MVWKKTQVNISKNSRKFVKNLIFSQLQFLIYEISAKIASKLKKFKVLPTWVGIHNLLQKCQKSLLYSFMFVTSRKSVVLELSQWPDLTLKPREWKRWRRRRRGSTKPQLHRPSYSSSSSYGRGRGISRRPSRRNHCPSSPIRSSLSSQAGNRLTATRYSPQQFYRGNQRDRTRYM